MSLFFLSSEMQKMEEITALILIIENKSMFGLYSEIEFLQQIKAGYLILEHMEDWMSGLNQHTANVQGHWLRRFESFIFRSLFSINLVSFRSHKDNPVMG